MHVSQRRALRRGAAVLGVAVAAAALGAPTVAQAGTVNTDPNSLVVWSNNVENMAPKSACGNDWNQLFTYIKAQSKSPDIFSVQQITDAAQLKSLTDRMSAELPGTYEGKIAIADPGQVYPGSTGKCEPYKNKQTNAVIYRTDRFTYEESTRWRSDAPTNFTGGCANLTPTQYEGKPTSQDRVENVAVRLNDRVRGEDVTVASVHWPTDTWNGPECAAENMKEANEAVDRLGGSLKIVAGDMNATKGAAGWWNKAIDYGFRDPIAESCGSAPCPDSTSTNGTRRIDYLLVKSGHGFSGARTISKEMTGGVAYSDHRALTGSVKY